MMSGNRTEEQVIEFKSLFSYFGESGGDPIQPNELNVVMRAFGQNPTDAELYEINEIIEKDGNPQITFPYFLSLMSLKM
jgi:calmodulin